MKWVEKVPAVLNGACWNTLLIGLIAPLVKKKYGPFRKFLSLKMNLLLCQQPLKRNIVAD